MADYSCPDAELVLSVDRAKDRDLWLATRRQGIGGSDMAALMGEPKYTTEFDVWLSKTGRETESSVTLAMEMGTRWEQGVADKFSEDHGLAVQRRGLMRSKHEPVLLANVDRLVEDGMGLECKAVNGWTKMPNDERHCNMLPYWYWQCVAYILATGRRGWYLAAAIGNTDWVERTVMRDDPQVQEDMARILEVAPVWWQEHVVEGKVPSMGAPPELPDLPEKDRYEFFIPEEGLELRDRLREIRDTAKALKAEDAAIKAKLQAEAGGARWLYADGRPILEFNPKRGRSTFQKKQFFAQMPLDGVELSDWLANASAEDIDTVDLSRFAMTEADYTTRGDPSTALLIVGDAEER